MSSQQHTPEPWKVFTVYAHPEIRDADDAFIASLPAGYVITARRIVACVNACAGLPTEELEAYKGYQISSGLQLIVMKQQRDELLADVERCYKMLLSEPDTKGALFKAENVLREVIRIRKRWCSMTKACIAELQYAADHRCLPDIDDIDAANILHEIDRLRTENEALRKDAARWQHMRLQDNGSAYRIMNPRSVFLSEADYGDPADRDGEQMTPDEYAMYIDAAIDAAMNK